MLGIIDYSTRTIYANTTKKSECYFQGSIIMYLLRVCKALRKLNISDDNKTMKYDLLSYQGINDP